MSEQQLALNKIKKSLGKVPPKKLGKMWREYHEKYIENKVDKYAEAAKIFTGGLI